MNEYTIILSTRDHVWQGAISNIDQSTIKVVHNMNSANEISFDVYHEADGLIEPRWDELKVLKLIYVVELEEYFEIDISYKDSVDQIMSITGKSACECELGQINLYDIEINSEADIDRDDYVETKFYNSENHKASLLHRILDKAPHYSIAHVDASLIDLQRTFSINGTSIYDFLTGDCADNFNCFFTFDSVNRTISAYDLYTTCQDCGYRGDYVDTCPECGSHNLKYYGEDTLIYVDKDNLTEEVDLTIDTSSIKNCLKLSAGDDTITTIIRGMNPNGSDYLYYFNDDTLADMPSDLVAKLNQYDEDFEYYQKTNPIEISNVDTYNSLVTKYNTIIKEQGSYCDQVDSIPNPIVGYPALTQALYSTIELQLILQSSLMPGITKEGVSAESEANKIYQAYLGTSTVGKLSPVGQSTVSDKSSSSTACSAIKNFSKIFVKSGYVKIEVFSTNEIIYDESSAQTDGSGNKYKNWQGYYKITNYSDEEDIAFICENGVIVPADLESNSEIEKARAAAESAPMTIKIYDNYQEFMNQRVLKKIASESDDNSIYDMVSFKITDDNWNPDETKEAAFRTALSYYSLSRLQSFYDVCNAALDVLSDSIPTLDAMYLSYYKKSQMCAEAIDEISVDIDIVSGVNTEISLRQSDINKKLNIQNYLGDDLYKKFCMYRREGEYSNSNYTSDGLTTAEQFTRTEEFMTVANEEMIKAGTPQYTISANVFNLLKIKEFKSIRDKFQLGNWIRVRAGEQVFRLRLLSYTDDNNNDTDLNVEFSNVTVAGGIVNDIQSVLSSAQSMSSSYGYVQNQASSAKTTSSETSQILTDSLTSAQRVIANNNNEEVVVDHLGITAKVYDDISETYEPKQMRITHNIMCFTDDNWATVSLALGNHTTTVYDYESGKISSKPLTAYGLSAEFVTAGYVTGSKVYGSTIISGDIYSENYTATTGSHINLKNGTFELGANKLIWNGSKLTVNGRIEANEGYIGDSSSGWTIASNSIYNGITDITIDTSGKQTGTYVGVDGLRNQSLSKYTQITEGKITTNDVEITGGSITIGNNFSVDSNGNLIAKSASISGAITATSGTFSNVTINSDCTIKGNIEGTASNITGTITASQINSAGLHVSAANIDGTLSASQINASSLHVSAANIDGTITASQINATDLKVSSANITGSITASSVTTTCQSNISSATIKSIESGSLSTITLKGTYVTASSTFKFNGSSISKSGSITVVEGFGSGAAGTGSNKITLWSAGDTIGKTSAGIAVKASSDMTINLVRKSLYYLTY